MINVSHRVGGLEDIAIDVFHRVGGLESPVLGLLSILILIKSISYKNMHIFQFVSSCEIDNLNATYEEMGLPKIELAKQQLSAIFPNLAGFSILSQT